MGFDNRCSRLCGMIHFRHGLVTHGVLGVFEAAAFEEDILCNAHGSESDQLVAVYERDAVGNHPCSGL